MVRQEKHLRIFVWVILKLQTVAAIKRPFLRTHVRCRQNLDQLHDILLCTYSEKLCSSMEERDFQYPIIISVFILKLYCTLAYINWIFYFSYMHTVNTICTFLRRYMSCMYLFLHDSVYNLCDSLKMAL